MAVSTLQWLATIALCLHYLLNELWNEHKNCEILSTTTCRSIRLDYGFYLCKRLLVMGFCMGYRYFDYEPSPFCYTIIGCKLTDGGTTLNKPPIGLHVKILNFNGRFEAFSARYGMFLFHQPIQNWWKFNICFNVWVVFRLVFTVRACKQRPLCFWPVFKPQNVIPTSSHYTGLLS